MMLADIVATSTAVIATSSRVAKRDLIAALLAAVGPDDVAAAVGMLTGEARQGRIGVGWGTLRRLDSVPSPTPSLTVAEVDRTLTAIASMSGPGSTDARTGALTALFTAATDPEQQYLRRLLLGELRQGAQEGVMVEAIAAAARVRAAAVRRALMLNGDLGETAAAALAGGQAALDRIGLRVMRPVRPMLASSSESVADALVEPALPVAVEWKLDGARIQVHKHDDRVAIFTRNLNDVTARLPHVVSTVATLPARSLVLDGEVLGMVDGDSEPGAGPDDDAPVSPGREASLPAEHHAVGTPRPFQDTMRQFSRRGGPGAQNLQTWFFDVLFADGDSLVDEPLSVRSPLLTQLVGTMRMPGIITADGAEADSFFRAAIAAGHEGVMVKDLAGTYTAGRRGASWRKVKPVHVVDLVILGAEWGHGRRQGWLSNLHLGARDPSDPGRFVMVGKTFKGLTDAMLEWQTAALLEREIGREGIVVHTRPDLVVEVALDGVQRSVRYPGGVALRFARVRRHRPDKSAAEADTIDTVVGLLPPIR